MSISEEKYKTSTTYMLPFEKMHGLGNDFVVVNNLHLPEDSNEEFESDLALKICNRHFGVGADGLIIIDNPKQSQSAASLGASTILMALLLKCAEMVFAALLNTFMNTV